MEKGKFDEANLEFCKALELSLSPAQPGSIWCNLGHVQTQQGNDEYAIQFYEHAIKCYRATIVVDPQVGDAHFSLGLALQTMGDRINERCLCELYSVS
jgi:tetratricopeptide (TPR) repeat protein